MGIIEVIELVEYVGGKVEDEDLKVLLRAYWVGLKEFERGLTEDWDSKKGKGPF